MINFVLEFLDLPLACLQLLLNLGKVRLEFLLVADVAGLSLHGRDLLLFLLGQGLLLHHFELLLKCRELGEHDLAFMLKLLGK